MVTMLSKEQNLFLVEFLDEICKQKQKYIKVKMMDDVSNIHSIESELEISKKLNEIITELKSN
jgi:hypothetical protein